MVLVLELSLQYFFFLFTEGKDTKFLKYSLFLISFMFLYTQVPVPDYFRSTHLIFCRILQIFTLYGSVLFCSHFRNALLLFYLSLIKFSAHGIYALFLSNCVFIHQTNS